MDWSHIVPTPSGYQADIYDESANLESSFNINALAGTGKTTVLVNIGDISQLRSKFLFVAFSKIIAQTLEKRLPDNICKTLHSLGYEALRKGRPLIRKWDIQHSKYSDLMRAHLEPIKRKKNGIQSTGYQSLLKKLDDIDENGTGIWKMSEIISKLMLTMTPPDADNIELMADRYNIELPLDTEELEEIATKTIMTGRELAFNSGIINFDEMIYWPAMERMRFEPMHTVAVDEVQDLNRLQHELLSLIPKERLITVGDRNQCQPAGTKILRIGKNRDLAGNIRYQSNIEDLQVGDHIAGHHPRDNRIYSNRRVNQVASRHYKGEMIKVNIPGIIPKESSYTPNHKCYAKISNMQGRTFLYLMKKKNQFRIGVSEFTSGNGRSFLTRLWTEKADAIWLLDSFPTRREALIAEAVASHKFSIPQVCFSSEKHNIKNFAPEFWASVGDNTDKANICLKAYGRLIEYPIFTDTKDIQQSIKRPQIIHACNLMSGFLFAIPTVNNRIEWLEGNVERYDYNGLVYSLDVQDKLYVADGIVTHNSIMAFAGALSDSVDRLVDMFELKELPLSVCYRCGIDIVKHARELVPEIEYFEKSPLGLIRNISDTDLVQEIRKTWEFTSNLPKPGRIFILCRLNAPLVSKCFQLIMAGFGARIRGKDIAEELNKTVIRVSLQDKSGFVMELFELYLDKYYEREKNNILRRGGRRAKILLTMLGDQIECLRTFYEKLSPSTVYEMTEGIKRLFTDGNNAQVTLMSCHKSKGLEAEHVFIIEPHKLPLVLPNQSEEEIQQERNLLYVARTRAINELVYVDSTQGD